MKATSLLLLMLLTSCGKAPADPVKLVSHRFTWAWSLRDASAPDLGQARILSCSEAGVSLLGLALRDSHGTITPYEYECRSRGEGETDPLPDGKYTVGVAALDGQKRILSDLTFMEENIGGDRDLGEVLFPLRAR